MNKTRMTTAIIAATMSITTAAGATTTHSPLPLPKWMTTPCAQEDSYNCFWDAGSRGNHAGYSFFVRLMPARTGTARTYCVFYPAHPSKDYCDRP